MYNLQKELDSRTIPYKKPGWLTTLSFLAVLSWFILTLLQEDPNLFVLVGTIYTILTIVARLHSRSEAALELEGGISGYLIAWLVIFFLYAKKTAIITLLDVPFQVNELMVFLLVVVLLFWFIISKRQARQEIIWKLPPFYSYLVLNLWKLAVIFVFLSATLQELVFLREAAIWFFTFSGYLDLILFYRRQTRVDFVDIILNPLKLTITLIGGLFEIIKWTSLTLIFIVLDYLVVRDVRSLSLIIGSMLVGFVTLSINVYRLSTASGVFESRVETGKVVIPQMIDEIRHMSDPDQLEEFDSFYEVIKDLYLKKKHETILFKQGDIVSRIPFSSTLQQQTGVFVVQIDFKKYLRGIQKQLKDQGKYVQRQDGKLKFTEDFPKPGTEEFKELIRPSRKQINLSGFNIHRLSIDSWNQLQRNATRMDNNQLAELFGFDSFEDIKVMYADVIKQTVKVQEQVRSRLRGVPAPPLGTEFSYKSSKIHNSQVSLEIPPDLAAQKNLQDGDRLEIIPGKGEYIFYIRKKDLSIPSKEIENRKLGKVIEFKPIKAQFIKIECLERSSEYGYSLWEIEVFGPEHNDKNLALHKSITASSIQNATYTPKKAVDGDMLTRWSSEFSDSQWIKLDLGQPYTINKILLFWEVAYAKVYKLLVSDDGDTWTEVYSTIDGP